MDLYITYVSSVVFVYVTTNSTLRGPFSSLYHHFVSQTDREEHIPNPSSNSDNPAYLFDISDAISNSVPHWVR